MPSQPPLQPGTHYHIYNRGNNGENLFIQERNYHYFLELYAHHIYPVADTFVYCLLKNHFHILLRVKHPNDLARSPSQSFSNLFNAYARVFNRMYDRTGTLFQRPFQRIPVQSEAYFARLVIYIHQNPQRHGFVNDYREWPHSSYQTALSTKPTRLQRDEVIQWFGSERNFIQQHQYADINACQSLLIEEDD